MWITHADIGSMWGPHAACTLFVDEQHGAKASRISALPAATTALSGACLKQLQARRSASCWLAATAGSEAADARYETRGPEHAMDPASLGKGCSALLVCIMNN